MGLFFVVVGDDPWLSESQAERLDLMCRCQSQEQQVADLRKLVNEIAKLEQGAPDVAGISADANWETQSVCSDVSGVSEEDDTLYLSDNY